MSNATGAMAAAARIGVASALLLWLVAPAEGQAPGRTSFLVLQAGVSVGHVDVSIDRDEQGWRVRGSAETGGSIGVTVRQFDARYDPGWRGRFLTVERATAGAATVVHVAVGAGTAHTDIVNRTEARWRSHSVSPDVVFVPEHAYAGFAAVAARLQASGPRAEIPLLLPPDGEQRAVVDAWERVSVRTAVGPLAVDRHTLTTVGVSPWQVHVWEADGNLVRVDLPRDGITVVRADVMP